MSKKLIFSLLTLVLFLPLPIFALSAQNGNMVILGENETIDGNYYAAGGNIEIYGTVNGDLFLAGNSIKINSDNINGDIFIAANSIKIKGQINGSLRLAGQYITLEESEISRNVAALGQFFYLEKEASVLGHLGFVGQSLSLSGIVQGKVEAALATFQLSGQAQNDVELYFGQSTEQSISLTDEAVVGGALYYQSLSQEEINQNADIVGGVHFNKVVKKNQEGFDSSKFLGLLFKFFGLLIVGMVGLYLWPGFFHRSSELFYQKPLPTFFKGLMFLLMVPVLSLLLMFSFIGLPLALLIMVLWLMALYLAQIITAWLLGKLVKDKIFKNKTWPNLTILALGIFLYIVLGKIPLVGWMFIIFFYLLAWGVLFNLLSGLKTKKQ